MKEGESFRFHTARMCAACILLGCLKGCRSNYVEESRNKTGGSE